MPASASSSTSPFAELPAVTRMLVSMRGEIEAARALVCETGLWVDRLKAYDASFGRECLPPTLSCASGRKWPASLADALTPMAKFYATEMGNRVCYQAMQIHGGVGYMRDFNVERHYRDVRVTNIYEGTSQLQVVAVTGKLLGHALDPLLERWAGSEVDAELEPLRDQLIEANALFMRTTDALKEKEREVIDYYAVDLVEMAAYLCNSWLLLQDAGREARKANLVHGLCG